MDIPNETESNPQVPHQAGFVPPTFPPFNAVLPQLGTTGSGGTAASISNDNGSSSADEEDYDDDQLNNVMDEDGNSMGSESMASNCSWQTGQTTDTPPPPQRPVTGDSGGTGGSSRPRRNMGGRRPNKHSNLSPEEEEKRQVRRERNKLAAARCRKRRVDHTNELTGEVEGLEKKKLNLQSEIQDLQQEKEELEFILVAHREQCRMIGRSHSPLDIKPSVNQFITMAANKIKSEPLEFDMAAPRSVPSNTVVNALSKKPLPPPSPMSSDSMLLNNPLMSSATAKSSTTATSKPNRPSSLAVPLTMTPSQILSGIPISTPSNGIFNYDSLMDGGTGLTPVAGPLVPTSTGLQASLQNRSVLDLVTPTSEPSKLVSL